jgi:hypothetical protein
MATNVLYYCTLNIDSLVLWCQAELLSLRGFVHANPDTYKSIFDTLLLQNGFIRDAFLRCRSVHGPVADNPRLSSLCVGQQQFYRKQNME